MTKEIEKFSADATSREELRRAFGRFGTGVTVITTLTGMGPLGMTANSFSSVSLDPPLVLWSAALSSKRHDAFATAQSFAIHVLSEEQQDLANHFAANGDGFDAFEWAEGPGGAPTFPGCLATFHCDTHAVHPAGDHSLILGMVRHTTILSDPQCGGLMFDRGRFGRFAPLDDLPQ